ncbi:alpha/beta hydrolase [Thalassotalea sp. HSM 43]|uniref:alpha/beta hydrolase n=1 Tax=Thalassotalea sp. HSM 43 TaxID=2552945 RepID=UPI00107FFEF0|nr:alpha/beta hydrolase [Thalassotalea sp. HSM 43]QBY04911.1 alpha/beta hydrolase [Thalassotalea sp. HSM 43]
MKTIIITFNNVSDIAMLYREFDLEQLETQYSPSSCIDDINVFIQRYVDDSKSSALWAEQHQSLRSNLAYGDSEDELIDMYLPTAKQAKGKLQVYIHGGYWQQLTKDESAFAANNFQQLGCHFAVINYALAPKVRLADIVEQNRRAIAWLYLNADKFGYDAEQIYLSGSSAGGHLAMLMAQTDWRQYGIENGDFIKGICAVSGIYDLEPIAHTYINEPLQLSEQEIQTLSPIRLSTPQCQVIIAYGDNETSEFKRQSDDMARRLDCASLQVARCNHFDVIMELSDANSTLCQQVIKQMQLA